MVHRKAQPSSSRRINRPLKSHNCGNEGHFVYDCPERSTNSIVQISGRPKPQLASNRQLLPIHQSSSNIRDDSDDRAQHSEFLPLPRGFDPWEKTDGAYRLITIASQTETCIEPKHTNGLFELCICGCMAHCAAARIEIYKWIEEHTNGGLGERKWAKIHAYDPVNDPAIAQKHEQIQSVQKFRQPLPPGKHVKFVRFLSWTTGWAPSKELGRNLEALDGIRTKFRTYIEFVQDHPEHGDCFKISGNHLEKLDSVEKRLVRVEKQVVARKSDPVQYILTKPVKSLDDSPNRSPHGVRQLVYTKPQYFTANSLSYNVPENLVYMVLETNMIASQRQADTLKDMTPRLIPQKSLKDASYLINKSVSTWFSQLTLLPFYHGLIRMRASIGTFVFSEYMTSESETYSMGAFKEMLEDCNSEDNQLEGYITSE
jgi:hypothetical protein